MSTSWGTDEVMWPLGLYWATVVVKPFQLAQNSSTACVINKMSLGRDANPILKKLGWHLKYKKKECSHLFIVN